MKALSHAKMILALLSIICIIAIASACLKKPADIKTNAAGSVIICEVAEKKPAEDSDGSLKVCDWIKVKNSGKGMVDLYGFTIRCVRSMRSGYVFPHIILEPEETTIVFADGGHRSNEVPFKIKGQNNDTLMLFEPFGNMIDHVTLPNLRESQSYVRLADDTWTVNTYTDKNKIEPVINEMGMDEDYQKGPVIITEVMSNNKSYAETGFGSFEDYIELKNTSDHAVDLKGLYLSDKISRPTQWELPDKKLEAGEYILIYCDGKDIRDGEEIHSSFRINAHGEELVLAAQDTKILSKVTIPHLGKDKAYMWVEDGWSTEQQPSPGYANTIQNMDSVKLPDK